jgi:lauroyl/myristoyl acyltransferase
MVAVGLGAAFREMNAPPPVAAVPPSRPVGWVNRCLRAVFLPVFRFLFRQMGTLPPARAEPLARALGVLKALPQRRRQGENFAKLFPRLDAREVRTLRARHVRYLARMSIHIARSLHQPAGEVRARVVLRGEEHLRAALARGRGALVVGAHFGTWWHAPGRLAVEGIKVSTVVNSALDAPMASFMERLGSRYGVTLAYVNQDAYGAARDAFQRNEVFYIAFDRSLRPERSLQLPLAGAQLPVDPGPAILALRQRPAVLWVGCHHEPDGTSVVELLPELAIGPGTALRTAEALSREWVGRLEKDLARWPEQWWPASFSSLTPSAVLPSPAVGRPADTRQTG